jgi:hypothetical protein
MFDATTECCYYVRESELGEGMATMHLRLVPARSGQQRGIRPATDYLHL